MGGVLFQAELAVTPLEKQIGLGGRDDLPRDTGMLFLYGEEGLYSFWMRGMRFPLDFLWITGDCTLLEVTADVPPPEEGTPDSSLPIFLPSGPVRFVMEINGGVAQERDIHPGDEVRFFGAELTGYGC